jgi:hypothetical protein
MLNLLQEFEDKLTNGKLIIPICNICHETFVAITVRHAFIMTNTGRKCF